LTDEGDFKSNGLVRVIELALASPLFRLGKIKKLGSTPHHRLRRSFPTKGKPMNRGRLARI
jgi:hypothetical protein